MEQKKELTNQNEEVGKEVVDQLSENVTNCDTVPTGEFTMQRTVFKEASAMYMFLNSIAGIDKAILEDVQLITETEEKLITFIRNMYGSVQACFLSRDELSLYINALSDFIDVVKTKKVAEPVDEHIDDELFCLRSTLGFAKENFELNDTEREKLKNERIEYLTNPPANPLEGFGSKVKTVIV